ncbi:unnamed protein product [Linum tenue]|uniref:ZF-HD dimerization-type domain-containing protein n=1 Tax=Linum tenue TaxID=586396 RepID=A0AAV0KIP3_9ROSI|nr:unnamed protein product [Linum tenue]
MEFEDQPDLHEQEEEEEDEEEDEDEEEANEEERFVATYDLVGNNNNNDIHNSPSSSRPKLSTATGAQEQTPAVAGTPTRRRSKYRECLKNQAVGIGSHAVDGCGEFLPSGPDGTVDALKCAACTCHRNFHRLENGEYSTTASPPLFFHHHAALLPAPPPPPHLPPPATPRPQQFAPHYRSSAASATAGRSNKRRPPPLTLPSTASGGGGGGGRKRFRTRFTAEQKERMFELAERLGWRIQKEDEAVVQQFCQEWGLRRQVLKVWMHNNKHTLGLIPNNNNNNNNPSPQLQN